MGASESKATDEGQELKSIGVGEPITYQDAVNMLSDYMKGMTENVNDGSSGLINRMEEMVTDLLSQALNFPSFVEYEGEDKELSNKISSLWWVTPKHLDARFDTENHCTLESFSHAIHAVAILTTKSNAFEMLSCVVECCKYVMDGLDKQGTGADDLLPGIIYVVLKSNPPRLYSHLKFLSNFLDLNKQALNSSHRINTAVPRLFGTIMDCCFSNLLIAVTTVKNIEANEDTEMIEYGRGQLEYLEGEYQQGLSDQFEEELDDSFDELEVAMQRMIRVRIEIRDRHREDMLKIADRLDENKRSVHISKAVGLFAAIGGGIISIVGFGLMFTTFGASAVLIPLGASIGGAGGLTASVSGFIEYGIKKSKANDIKKLREEYESVINEVFGSLKKIEKSVNNIWTLFNIAGKTAKTIVILFDVVMKLGRLVVAIDNVSDVGITAFRVASTTGRGLAIAGFVFSVIMLPIDMIFFGISLKKLKDNEKASQAEEIRSWLEQDLPDEMYISRIVSKLKNGLFNFLRDVKAHAHDKNNTSIIESENQLKLAFEEVKEMIINELL